MRQAITLITDDLLFTGLARTNFSEIGMKMKKIFIQENAFENVVCIMAATSFMPQWLYEISLNKTKRLVYLSSAFRNREKNFGLIPRVLDLNCPTPWPTTPLNEKIKYRLVQWRHKSVMASQITSDSTVCSATCSRYHQRKLKLCINSDSELSSQTCCEIYNGLPSMFARGIHCKFPSHKVNDAENVSM